jgi:hybrid polyketide synthase/nonribosomal peptide synthetase ACE1
VALAELHRKVGAATGLIANMPQSEFLIHPATIDAAFQSVLLAASAPGDGRLTSIHLPISVRYLTFDVELCLRAQQRGHFAFDASQSKDNAISGDVDMVDPKTDRIIVQVESLCCRPLTVTTPAADKLLFSRTVWVPLLPNAVIVASQEKTSQAQYQTACQLERVSWFYLRMLESHIPKDHPSRHQGPYVAFFDFISHAHSRREARGQPWWHAHWEKDTMQDIKALCDRVPDVADLRLLRTLGESIVDIVTGDLLAIEVAMKGDNLGNYYQHGLGTAEYTVYLARVVAQIALRFPHLQCLEIGAGTGGATRAIFHEAKQSFLSYTFTDVSSGFFSSAETEFKETPVRMFYKVLDVNIDPGLQGFANHSYDVVIASLVLHTTLSLSQTLKNIRQILKPGGYLVVLELRKDLPVRWTAMFGCFPGWWIGSDDGRRLSPCIDVEEWHTLLRECGFSGCDTVTPNIDTFTQPLTVFVSQATDERVNFRRDPLSCLDNMSSLGFGDSLNDLVVLGGGYREISELIDQLDIRFRRQWTTIKIARTLEELGSIALSPKSTVLSLIELDRPIFRDMCAAQWEQLKLLFQGPNFIMWVTSGRRASEPYANMLAGAARVAKNEVLGLNIQFLDIEDRDQLSIALLAAFLLRFRASTYWQQEQNDMAFTQVERELIVSSGGHVLVPRLIPDGAMNDRYNSSHRAIKKLVDIRESEVSLTLTQNGYILEEGWNHKRKSDDGGTHKQITHSLLTPILVSSQNLFLAIGRDEDSGQFLALSDRQISLVTADRALICTVKVPDGREAEFLTLASQICFAYDNLRGLEEDDHLLVLEPSSAMVIFLSPIAQERSLRLTFITSQAKGMPYSFVLHPCAPNRELETLDLSSATVFMDLSKREPNERLVARIRSIVPPWCKYASLHAEISGSRSAMAKSKLRVTPRLRCELEKIAIETSELLSDSSSENASFNQVSLADVCDTRHIKPRSIVHWSSNGKVAVQVRPVDASVLFSPNKTYWLVGLTGTLGMSLCEWMIHHGARYVVLSSRAPKVETRWQEEMTSLGATVWIRFWYNLNNILRCLNFRLLVLVTFQRQAV